MWRIRIRKAYSIIKYRVQQKKYKHISYLFRASRSPNCRILIVVFSGFSKMGNPPIYNYVKTLESIDVNKLFLLDNFGYNKAGCYYIGENGDYFLTKEIVELTEITKQKISATRIITAGSSKGGSAALYYGAKMKADDIIVGAPQYFIGDYLNTDKHKCILKGICGDDTQKSIDFLNKWVGSELITEYQPKPTIYLHYSPKEHTYNDQIADLISDMRKCNYKIIEDNDYTYSEHGDVALFFGDFLMKKIGDIQKNCNCN